MTLLIFALFLSPVSASPLGKYKSSDQMATAVCQTDRCSTVCAFILHHICCFSASCFCTCFLVTPMTCNGKHAKEQYSAFISAPLKKNTESVWKCGILMNNCLFISTCNIYKQLVWKKYSINKYIYRYIEKKTDIPCLGQQLSHPGVFQF